MASSTLPRIFSGIQPTSGIPHIGNYLGAIQRWARLLNSEDRMKLFQQQPIAETPDEKAVNDSVLRNSWKSTQLMYCIVDLHAITVPYDTKTFQSNCQDVAASLLGCGLNPDQCVIFRQSDVRQHSELSWLLSCLTSTAWLNRMTQYKDKVKKQRKNEATLGLYSYPVLMTSDILLYQATHVPVGDDQRQHIELARMIATTFNERFQTSFFPKPQGLIDSQPAHRIMSLKNPNNKMSKSDESELSRITLTDSADDIQKKIQKAKTDSLIGISYDPIERPGVSNLISMYAALSTSSIPTILQDYENASMREFKQALTDLMVEKLVPIGEEIQKYQRDPVYLQQILKENGLKASEEAENTMKQVKQLMGIY